MKITRLRIPILLAVLHLAAVGASAAVDLRIESRPIAGPVEAFVRITADGEDVAGLQAGDFTVRLDGRQVDRLAFRLPPDQDDAQSLSIMLVLADGRTVESAKSAITRLPIGTYVAVVRPRYSAGDPMPWLAQHAFTRIDGDTGSQSLADFLTLSIHDLAMLRYGSLVPHLDWLSAGLDQLEAPGITLPRGPKAIVLVGHGRYIESWSVLTQSSLMGRANALGVPVFTIGTEDFSGRPAIADFMSAVARDTGGRYLRGRTAEALGKAYRRIWALLGGAYRLALAPARVTDCDPHTLNVTVGGETASASFVRCDTTPDPLEFESQDGVAAETVVVSNAATITGIESPVEVAVYGGSYSLGCGSSFTRAPGVAEPGDLVCVRHVAAAAGGASVTTTLVVGGVAAHFQSTTRVGN